jgi:outer membrane receptor protein involved in Fe transport
VDRNNAFEHREATHAVYLQAARTVGQVSVQGGLRAESALTTFTLLDSIGARQDFDNDYASLFPSAFVTYRPTENDLFRASYSRRIDRVRTHFLNPFPRYDDPLNLSVGNPALQPQYVDALEVGYVRQLPIGSLTFTPFWRRTTDVIRRVQRVRDDGVTVSTFENLDTSLSWGLEAILAFEGSGVMRGLRGHASFEGYRVATDGSNAEADLTNDAFGWGGGLNVTYAIREGTDMQASVRYRAPMANEQGRSGSMVFTQAAFRQRLGDRATLSIRARDPFGLARFSSILDEPSLYQTFERTMGGPEVGLTLTYAVGQRPRQRDQQDDRDEQPETGEVGFQ